MTSVHLLQLRLQPPQLMRFAAEQGLLLDDDGFGYTLHAWLATLFGEHAPKPFRYLASRQALLGYALQPHDVLAQRAREFATPEAYAALEPDSLVSKPMPDRWLEGRRLHLEVLACPVSRKDDQEKDVYLRALDRLGDAAPSRAAVYAQWFARQWGGAVRFETLDVVGMSARRKLLRRARNGHARLVPVERPQAVFVADVAVADPARFGELLVRGIGRHRAFGFGMVLLSPPR